VLAGTFLALAVPGYLWAGRRGLPGGTRGRCGVRAGGAPDLRAPLLPECAARAVVLRAAAPVALASWRCWPFGSRCGAGSGRSARRLAELALWVLALGLLCAPAGGTLPARGRRLGPGRARRRARPGGGGRVTPSGRGGCWAPCSSPARCWPPPSRCGAPLDPFDEGLLLQAAARMAAGGMALRRLRLVLWSRASACRSTRLRGLRHQRRLVAGCCAR
jgi:hypothetical protein